MAELKTKKPKLAIAPPTDVADAVPGAAAAADEAMDEIDSDSDSSITSNSSSNGDSTGTSSDSGTKRKSKKTKKSKKGGKKSKKGKKTKKDSKQSKKDKKTKKDKKRKKAKEETLAEQKTREKADAAAQKEVQKVLLNQAKNAELVLHKIQPVLVDIETYMNKPTWTQVPELVRNSVERHHAEFTAMERLAGTALDSRELVPGMPLLKDTRKHTSVPLLLSGLNRLEFCVGVHARSTSADADR